jgi:hypothetical protein
MTDEGEVAAAIFVIEAAEPLIRPALTRGPPSPARGEGGRGE